MADTAESTLDNVNQANDLLTRRGKDPCPECGAQQVTWWEASHSDPDDVDPRARCTNPLCGWGY